MFSTKQIIWQRKREMRNHPTEAERRLWFVLRKRNLCGLKFRRQHNIGRYIVDFYCSSIGLVIEVDGSQHYTAEGLAYDQERTAYLQSQGIYVVRVVNADVYWRMESVLEYLHEVVSRLTHS